MSQTNINAVITFYNDVIVPSAKAAGITPYEYMHNIMQLIEHIENGIIQNITFPPVKEPIVEEVESAENLEVDEFNLVIQDFPKAGGWDGVTENMICIQKFNSHGEYGDNQILNLTYLTPERASKVFDLLANELTNDDHTLSCPF